tara:strand:- start:2009 stop:2329 length:321 start_codon:yes stop_codon:yes gene_type:complete
MENRYKEAKKYIENITNEPSPREDSIEDIAWKFTLGDVILSIADQKGFKDIEPGSDIETFDNDIIIGTNLCILVRKANEETLSEDEISESQPNPDDESADLGYENS